MVAQEWAANIEQVKPDYFFCFPPKPVGSTHWLSKQTDKYRLVPVSAVSRLFCLSSSSRIPIRITLRYWIGVWRSWDLCHHDDPCYWGTGMPAGAAAAAGRCQQCWLCAHGSTRSCRAPAAAATTEQQKPHPAGSHVHWSHWEFTPQLIFLSWFRRKQRLIEVTFFCCLLFYNTLNFFPGMGRMFHWFSLLVVLG